MKGMLGGERGLSAVGLVVFLVIFGAIYLAYLFAPVVINYYVAKEALQKTANMAYTERNDQYLMNDCEGRLRHAELPVVPGGCRIERGPNNEWSKVRYTYEVTVRFVPTGMEKPYRFDLEVTQDLSPNMRGGR